MKEVEARIGRYGESDWRDERNSVEERTEKLAKKYSRYGKRKREVYKKTRGSEC